MTVAALAPATAPPMESFAADLYASLEPLAWLDADNYYALAVLCTAIGIMFQEAEDLARDQDGVLSRRQLRQLGLSKAQIRHELRVRRWRRHGDHTVAIHTAELGQRARWRAAVFEVCGDAAIDGVTALLAAGLEGYDEPDIHISVSKSTRIMWAYPWSAGVGVLPGTRQSPDHWLSAQRRPAMD